MKKRVLLIIAGLLLPFVFVFAAGFVSEKIFHYYDSAGFVLVIFIILCVLALCNAVYQIIKIMQKKKDGGKR